MRHQHQPYPGILPRNDPSYLGWVQNALMVGLMMGTKLEYQGHFCCVDSISKGVDRRSTFVGRLIGNTLSGEHRVRAKYPHRFAPPFSFVRRGKTCKTSPASYYTPIWLNGGRGRKRCTSSSSHSQTSYYAFVRKSPESSITTSDFLSVSTHRLAES